MSNSAVCAPVTQPANPGDIGAAGQPSVIRNRFISSDEAELAIEVIRRASHPFTDEVAVVCALLGKEGAINDVREVETLADYCHADFYDELTDSIMPRAYALCWDVWRLEFTLRQLDGESKSIRCPDGIASAHRHLHHLMTREPFERIHYSMSFLDSITVGQWGDGEKIKSVWALQQRDDAFDRVHEIKQRLVSLVKDIIRLRERIAIRSAT